MDEKNAEQQVRNKENNNISHDSAVQGRAATISPMPSITYKPLPLSNLPSKGIYYSNEMELEIRSVRVEEIRHFSTIDEGDYIDINDKIHSIIEKCVKVKFPTKVGSWKDLLEIDVLYIVMCIRDITFGAEENKLQMNVSCKSCGHNDLVNLSKNTLSQFEIPEELKKYYDDETKSLKLVLKTGGELYIYLPTLGVANFIKNHMKTKVQAGQYIDKAFLNIAPYVIPGIHGLNEAKYNEYNQETYGWGHSKMSIIIGVIDMIKKAHDGDIHHECTSCGSEVTAPLTFQGGIKSLFLETNFLDQLL